MDKHINFSSEEERQAYELLKQIRDYERSLTEDERKKMESEHRRGANYICSLLEGMLNNIPKALATSSYLIREADRRHAFNDMESEILEVTQGEDPLVMVSKASVSAARINHNTIAQIRLALLAAKEFFRVESINEPVNSLLS